MKGKVKSAEMRTYVYVLAVVKVSGGRHDGFTVSFKSAIVSAKDEVDAYYRGYESDVWAGTNPIGDDEFSNDYVVLVPQGEPE